MSDRWQPIRERAARERALALTQGPAAGQTLAQAALELTGLEVVPLPAADPMLGGARAMAAPHQHVLISVQVLIRLALPPGEGIGKIQA